MIPGVRLGGEGRIHLDGVSVGLGNESGKHTSIQEMAAHEVCIYDRFVGS